MSNSSESPKDDYSFKDDSENEVDWVESPSNSDGDKGEMDVDTEPYQSSKSEYELSFDERIRRNIAKLDALGLIGRVSLADPSTPGPRLSSRQK